MTAPPITHDWQTPFLAALPDVANVMDAAKAAGVGHAYAYKARQRDPEFAALWDSIRDAKFYEERTCERCGQGFRYQRSSGRPGRFCSEACKFAHQRAEGEARAVEAFWAKVNKNGPTPLHAPQLGPCWIWLASKDDCGYGMYRRTRSHRFSWALANGPIAEGLCVLHGCDTPPCVRPSHLFLGTREDNMRDRQAKGRQARGERAGRAVLTASQVREARALRADGWPLADLAKRFGVAEPTIGQACLGLSWRHVA